MSTAPRPHPTLNAMLLCDHTIREHGTGKVSLIGIFENISAARFPVVHRSLSVYAKLVDAEGEYTIRLELLRLDDILKPLAPITSWFPHDTLAM